MVFQKLTVLLRRSRLPLWVSLSYSSRAKILVQPHERDAFLRATLFMQQTLRSSKSDQVVLLNRQLGLVFFKSLSIRVFCFKLNAKIFDQFSNQIRKFESKYLEKVRFPISAHNPDGSLLDVESDCNRSLKSNCFVRIGDVEYEIVRHSAAITNLVMPERIMLGSPIVASLDTTLCSYSDCTFRWYISDTKVTKYVPPASRSWKLLGEGPKIVIEDPYAVGHLVKLEAFPNSSTSLIPETAVSIVSKKPIHTAPFADSPISKRHAFTKERSNPGDFRMITYNLLANYYSRSEYSHTVLFPHCPPKYLHRNYRRGLLLWEMDNYNADVICFQEVDRRFYKSFLSRFFCGAGEFDGFFLPKSRTPAEGVAIFYRCDKFDLVKNCSVACITDELKTFEADDDIKTVRNYIESNPNASRIWDLMQHCLATVVLSCKENPDKRVTVATTHLVSKPICDHIRLLQFFVCLRHLERTRSQFQSAVALGGDFNSPPHNGLIEYAVDGIISDQHEDWRRDDCESIERPISHQLKLKSAYDYRSSDVFTNYTTIYQGCLDYLLYNEDLELKRCIPLPSADDLKLKVAIPNEYFPSDHVPLICDFSFAKN